MHGFAMFPLLQFGTVDLLTSTTIALAGAAFALLLFASLVILFVTRYKRCPANRVLVISGRVGGNEAARCISGGGVFVWPVIQEFA